MGRGSEFSHSLVHSSLFSLGSLTIFETAHSMSTVIASQAPSTSSGPIDPTTLTSPLLTLNNLQDLLEYRATPYTQASIISRVARPRGSHLCYITACTPG